MQPTDPPLTFDDVRRRSIRGLAALALRGGAGKLISITSFVILSRLLTPADFGVFAILLMPVGLLSLLADAGISAALIQRAEMLNEADEQAGFMLRLVLAVGLGMLVAAGAGLIGMVYGLDTSAVWALRALAAGPLMDAFGLVPGVRLTRALRFDRMAWAEIGSLVAGQGVAVGAAWAGLGLWSLALGALATSLGGMLLVNALAPWRPAPGLTRAAARRLLAFGLPYQSQGLLHLAIDQIIPALGGLWLASAQVGYLSWARAVARWPRIPADYVARVGFAAFSRLQRDPDGLNRLLEGALRLVCWLTFPVVALGLALAPHLVGPVFGTEWGPATGALRVFLAIIPLDALATVLLPIIYALGKAGRGLRISAAWAASIWTLGPALMLLWGNLLALPAAFAVTEVLILVLIVRSLPDRIRIHWRLAALKPMVLAAGVGGLALASLALWR